MLAIIGGSGCTRLANLKADRRTQVSTPYGDPSAPLTFGTISGRHVVFLPRHGEAHPIAPHLINYRANLWALHAQEAHDVLAIATVGGIRHDLAPGTLALPDQILDYTHGRDTTFWRAGDPSVTHVDFTLPYCESLRQRIVRAADQASEPIFVGGIYAATQGPRLESAAEIDRLERDGADMVGMTGMPEAALARELGLCYVTLAVVVNHAAGRGASARGIQLSQCAVVLQQVLGRVQNIIARLVGEQNGG